VSGPPYLPDFRHHVAEKLEAYGFQPHDLILERRVWYWSLSYFNVEARVRIDPAQRPEDVAERLNSAWNRALVGE
jgi:hypothetical protein